MGALAGEKPRVVSHAVRAASLLLLVLALPACERGSFVSITDWTLECDGCTRSAVHLPEGLGPRLPEGCTRFTLRAEVPLDPNVRGRELSLTMPSVYTLGSLRVGDEDIAPLDESIVDRVRPSDWQLVFRIPARATRGESLALALSLERHDPVVSAYIAFAPRLAVGAYGEPQARVAAAVNRTMTLAVLAVGIVLAVAYFVMFALDRRRVADAAFAVITTGVVVWHACVFGVTQLVDSEDLIHVPVLATVLICVTAPFFLNAHFASKAPPRALTLALGALGLATVGFSLRPWLPHSPTGRLMQLEILTAVVYIVWFLGRASFRGGDRRLEATVMLGSWGLVAAAALVNPIEQIQVSPIAWLAFIVLHAGLLARSHARSLRSLNVALADRVASLEERNREVATLADELRRQVGDRSARLVDALARAGPLSVRTAPLERGARVGDRYVVGDRLGEGAMGAVYAVERTSDGKLFAMKTVTHAEGGGSLARLAREAEIATKVAHPNLVGIVDVDVSQGGMLYIVMDLVRGRSLAADKKRFGDELAARGVLRQIAAGLRALHDAGIVHRDLKPANVLLEENGAGGPRAKIADFGIARLTTMSNSASVAAAIDPRAVTEDATSPRAVSNPALTRTGALLGTPLYMAPELARGAKDAQPSCDMWSFGVMAYELVGGRLPFDAPPIQVILATGTWRAEPPDTSAFGDALASVVTRCLDADPAKRMTAAEVEEALGKA
jgi:hypothetical protein